jgi:hypothetical protein
MKLALTFCVAFLIAALAFAVYFCCVVHVFPFDRSLAEFSAMFQPLRRSLPPWRLLPSLS